MRRFFRRADAPPAPQHSQSGQPPTPTVPYLFVSYRRQDSSVAAHWLAETLQETFGADRVFIDVDTIREGDDWSVRLETALAQTTVLVVVIGPNWLRAADHYGRRRLDLEDDWVRREIAYAIQNQRIILPVRVGRAEMLETAALPPSVAKLPHYQNYELRDEHWNNDVNELVSRLEALGFVRLTPRVQYPQPHSHPTPLTESELDAALVRLPYWRVMTSPIPGLEPQKRVELMRSYEFTTFEEAIAFMTAASQHISEVNHHPRWENLWCTVTVWLTTWDIGHRPSSIDIEIATYLDTLYAH